MNSNIRVPFHSHLINRSKHRCLHDFGLQPEQYNDIHILTGQELAEHQATVEEFLSIAKKGLLQLYQQVAHLDYSILLTDAKGVAVDYISNDKYKNKLKSVGLYLGSVWREKLSGTNAIGICLSERMPVTVHQGEHFYLAHKGLTCTAVPMYDHKDEVLAVLDVSALDSPKDKNSQHLLMQLALMQAQNIENAYFYHFFRDKWIIQFSKIREYADTNVENLIAFDGDGVICGINRNAKNIFTDTSIEIELDSRKFIGTFIRELFSFDFHNNIESINDIESINNMGSIVELRTLNPRKTFFAVIRLPKIKKSRPVIARENSENLLSKLAGADPLMQENISIAKRLIDKKIGFLIFGETGAGKELFAKAIHAESNRAGKPFIAVNCAAIPETLIESELFGYESGAFTGGRSKGMVGLIQQSSGGTLFLDEIGDMPLQLQSRLLRVLSEHEVMPLGSDKTVSVDLNVIAATHVDIHQFIKERKFRQDLYYRLCGITIQLPAFRDRKDKEFIIKRILLNESGNHNVSISADAMQLLLNHDWPGNCRELSNVLRVAISVSKQDVITYDDISLELRMKNNITSAQVNEPAFIIKTQSLINNSDSRHFPEKIKKLVVQLQENKWNITDTAYDLGISRATIYRHMKKYNIVPPNSRD
jgi:sigma-54 dependent transcriptional regulator, acetoin dehydrogenase operon transcriptional activator AcoR